MRDQKRIDATASLQAKSVAARLGRNFSQVLFRVVIATAGAGLGYFLGGFTPACSSTERVCFRARAALGPSRSR